MKLASLVTITLGANLSAEVFPEIPADEPIPKTVAGENHLKRRVQFRGRFVITSGSVVVTTELGTTALVKGVPKVDMRLLKSLDRSATMMVEGTLVAIEAREQRITV